jgi:D-xylose 1-dehydrogenase
MESHLFATYPSLRNRVVLVTGGASGIGEAIVEALAHQNARVAFLDIQEEVGQALAERIASAGGTPTIFNQCDLTDINSLQRTINRLASELGSIDVLINNAGNDTRHTIAEVTPESWDRIMALNLKHQFFAVQATIPFMKQAQRGSIINMSSIGWVIPSTGMPGYVTAKAAIVGLTRTLAHELGPDNIRVNSVMPGAILTKRQKELWFTQEYEAEILRGQALKRMIMPEEVARLVLFLAADDSSAITNQSYIIDGGWV